MVPGSRTMPSSCSRALQDPDREPTADPADTSMENLAQKLFESLQCMSQDIWELSTSHATGQAQPQEETLLEDDYDDCIYEKIVEWAQREISVHAFYNEPALQLNEKIWDMISHDDNGALKESTFHTGAE